MDTTNSIIARVTEDGRVAEVTRDEGGVTSAMLNAAISVEATARQFQDNLTNERVDSYSEFKANKIVKMSSPSPLGSMGDGENIKGNAIQIKMVNPVTIGSVTGQLQNCFLAKVDENEQDGHYGHWVGVIHYSVTYDATPIGTARSGDSMVNGGVYFIDYFEKDGVGHQYQIKQKLYEGGQWIGGNEYYNLFPAGSLARYAVRRGTGQFTSNVMIAAMYGGVNVEYDLADTVTVRDALYDMDFAGSLIDSGTKGRYAPLFFSENDVIALRTLPPAITDVVKFYSVDRDLCFRVNKNLSIDLIKTEKIIKKFNNTGDTFNFPGFAAFDVFGIKGVQADITAVLNSACIRVTGPTLKVNAGELISLVSGHERGSSEKQMNKIVYNSYPTGSQWDIYPEGTNTHQVTYVKIAEVSDSSAISNDQFSYVVKGFRDRRTALETIYTQYPNRIEITGANGVGFGNGIISRRLTPINHPYLQYIWHDVANRKYKAYVGGVSDMDDTIIEGIQERAMFEPEVRYVSRGTLKLRNWADQIEATWSQYHVERAMGLDDTDVKITHQADVFYHKGGNKLVVIRDTGQFVDFTLDADAVIYDVYCKVFNPINVAGHIQVVTNKDVFYIRHEPSDQSWHLYSSDATLIETNLRSKGLTGTIITMSHIDDPLTYIVTTTGLWMWENNSTLHSIVGATIDNTYDVHPNCLEINGYVFYTFATYECTYWIKATDSQHVNANLNLQSGPPLRIYQWEGIGFFQVCEYTILRLTTDTAGNLIFTSVFAPQVTYGFSGFLSDKRFVIPIIYGLSGAYRLNENLSITRLSTVPFLKVFANWQGTFAYLYSPQGGNKLYEIDVTDLSDVTDTGLDMGDYVNGGSQISDGTYIFSVDGHDYLQQMYSDDAQTPQSWGWEALPNTPFTTMEIEHRGMSMDYMMQQLITYVTNPPDAVLWKTSDFESFEVGLNDGALEKGMYEVTGYKYLCDVQTGEFLVSYINTGLVVETDGYYYLSQGGYQSYLPVGYFSRISKETKQVSQYYATEAGWWSPTGQRTGHPAPQQAMAMKDHPDWVYFSYLTNADGYGIACMNKHDDKVNMYQTASSAGYFTSSYKCFNAFIWYGALSAERSVKSLTTKNKKAVWVYDVNSTNAVGKIGIMEIPDASAGTRVKPRALTLASTSGDALRWMNSLCAITMANGQEALLYCRGNNGTAVNNGTTYYGVITAPMTGTDINWSGTLTDTQYTTTGIASGYTLWSERAYFIQFDDGVVMKPVYMNGPSTLGFVYTDIGGVQFTHFISWMVFTDEGGAVNTVNSHPIRISANKWVMLFNGYGQFGDASRDLPRLAIFTEDTSTGTVTITTQAAYEAASPIPILNRSATLGSVTAASTFYAWPYIEYDEETNCVWILYVRSILSTVITGRKWQANRINLTTGVVKQFNFAQYDELATWDGRTVNTAGNNYAGGIREFNCIFTDKNTGKTLIWPAGQSIYYVINTDDTVSCFTSFGSADLNLVSSSLSDALTVVQKMGSVVFFGQYWSHDLKNDTRRILQRKGVEPYINGTSNVCVVMQNSNKIRFNDGEEWIIPEGSAYTKMFSRIGNFYAMETWVINGLRQAVRLI